MSKKPKTSKNSDNSSTESADNNVPSTEEENSQVQDSTQDRTPEEKATSEITETVIEEVIHEEVEEANVKKTSTETTEKDSQNPPIDATPEKHRTRAPKNTWLWLAFIVLTLAFAGLCGSIYIGVKHGYKTKAAIENKIAALNQRLDEQDNQYTQQIQTANAKTAQAITTQLKQTQSTLSQYEKKTTHNVNELMKRVDAHQQRLRSLSTTSKEDWLLAEAEYLLKLANQRVLLEKTPQNAIALLSQADNIIYRVSAGLGDHELHAIRESLARELVALRSVKTIDREGIYLKLSAIMNTIDNIETIKPFQSINRTSKENTGKESTEREIASSDSNEAGIWSTIRTALSATLDSITNDFIRISDKNEVLVSTDTQRSLQLMQLNVRLLLEQAQLALLKQDTLLFQHSLQQAADLIARYYPESTHDYAFRADIQSLAKLDISPDLPDISNSVKLLHAFIENQHQLTPGGH